MAPFDLNQIGIQKAYIILALVWGILADFWVPHEIESCNFEKIQKTQKSVKIVPNRDQDDLDLYKRDIMQLFSADATI